MRMGWGRLSSWLKFCHRSQGKHFNSQKTTIAHSSQTSMWCGRKPGGGDVVRAVLCTCTRNTHGWVSGMDTRPQVTMCGVNVTGQRRAELAKSSTDMSCSESAGTGHPGWSEVSQIVSMHTRATWRTCDGCYWCQSSCNTKWNVTETWCFFQWLFHRKMIFRGRIL